MILLNAIIRLNYLSFLYENIIEDDICIELNFMYFMCLGL